MVLVPITDKKRWGTLQAKKHGTSSPRISFSPIKQFASRKRAHKKAPLPAAVDANPSTTSLPNPYNQESRGVHVKSPTNISIHLPKAENSDSQNESDREHDSNEESSDGGVSPKRQLPFKTHPPLHPSPPSTILPTKSLVDDVSCGYNETPHKAQRFVSVPHPLRPKTGQPIYLPHRSPSAITSRPRSEVSDCRTCSVASESFTATSFRGTSPYMTPPHIHHGRSIVSVGSTLDISDSFGASPYNVSQGRHALLDSNTPESPMPRLTSAPNFRARPKSSPAYRLVTDRPVTAPGTGSHKSKLKVSSIRPETVSLYGGYPVDMAEQLLYKIDMMDGIYDRKYFGQPITALHRMDAADGVIDGKYFGHQMRFFDSVPDMYSQTDAGLTSEAESTEYQSDLASTPHWTSWKSASEHSCPQQLHPKPPRPPSQQDQQHYPASQQSPRAPAQRPPSGPSHRQPSPPACQQSPHRQLPHRQSLHRQSSHPQSSHLQSPRKQSPRRKSAPQAHLGLEPGQEQQEPLYHQRRSRTAQQAQQQRAQSARVRSRTSQQSPRARLAQQQLLKQQSRPLLKQQGRVPSPQKYSSSVQSSGRRAHSTERQAQSGRAEPEAQSQGEMKRSQKLQERSSQWGAQSPEKCTQSPAKRVQSPKRCVHSSESGALSPNPDAQFPNQPVHSPQLPADQHTNSPEQLARSPKLHASAMEKHAVQPNSPQLGSPDQLGPSQLVSADVDVQQGGAAQRNVKLGSPLLKQQQPHMAAEEAEALRQDVLRSLRKTLLNNQERSAEDLAFLNDEEVHSSAIDWLHRALNLPVAELQALPIEHLPPKIDDCENLQKLKSYLASLGMQSPEVLQAMKLNAVRQAFIDTAHQFGGVPLGTLEELDTVQLLRQAEVLGNDAMQQLKSALREYGEQEENGTAATIQALRQKLMLLSIGDVTSWGHMTTHDIVCQARALRQAASESSRVVDRMLAHIVSLEEEARYDVMDAYHLNTSFCAAVIDTLNSVSSREEQELPELADQYKYVHPYLAKVAAIEAHYALGEKCPYYSPEKHCPFGHGSEIQIHEGAVVAPDGKRLGPLETPFWAFERPEVYCCDRD